MYITVSALRRIPIQVGDSELITLDELREPAHMLHDLSNADVAYVMHYDETNNIRRLHITPEGLNVRNLRSFVLGGIAHRETPQELEFKDLRSLFKLQKTVPELKLEYLGKGDFPSLLNCKKIGTLLSWLDGQDLFVHYQIVDPFFYSIVDIIDSIPFSDGGYAELFRFNFQFKSDLCKVLRADVDATADLLGSYNYPDIGLVRRKAFIAELINLLEVRRHVLPPFRLQMLKDVLQIAKRFDKLQFLEDETLGRLIDSFCNFYLNRFAIFKNATHILDNEEVIDSHLRKFDLRAGSAPLENVSFVDSRDCPWVQVSDAVVGILGKLIYFGNCTSGEAITDAQSKFTDQQHVNFQTLVRIIKRSIQECPFFAHYVAPLEDITTFELLLDSA